jgi:hypothetical protein
MATVSFPAADRKPPKRRWHQYSLRTLLILVTIFAVACSWFSVKMLAAERQRRAVEGLARSQCSVFYAYQTIASNESVASAEPRWEGHGASFDRNARKPAPQWMIDWLGIDFFSNVSEVFAMFGLSDDELKHVGDLTQLRILNAASEAVSDAGLAHIEKLDKLQELVLRSSPILLSPGRPMRVNGITDAGLVHLKGLDNLQTLYISCSQITDAGLEQLQALHKLQTLTLVSEAITDVGLIHLQAMSQLRALQLCGAKITDAGLVHIQAMGQLRALQLCSTKITDDGLIHLRKLSHLEALSLGLDNITDAGLIHLQELKQLKWLQLAFTKVTRQGVATLQQALPNCRIEFVAWPDGKTRPVGEQ